MKGAFAAAAVSFGLLGCSFSSASTSIQRNTCDVDADCTKGSSCTDGMCVGATSSGLQVSLEITPIRMPDGSLPVPIALGPLLLDGPSQRNLELPMPIMVTGDVRKGDKHIAAELHFTPVRGSELPTPTTQVVTTTGDIPVAPSKKNVVPPDYSVQLLGGVTYHVICQPTDRSLPPYSTELTVATGKTMSIDYAKVRWTAQSFLVQGAPTGRNLVMRAIDAQTGEPVSSSASVTTARATLVFGPAPVPDFKLELSSDEYAATTTAPHAPASGSKQACEATSPVFPVLRVARAALKDDETGTHVLVMPEIPAPISYSGFVDLCPGNSVRGLQGMPMALDARTLLLDAKGNIEASYNATTTAAPDANGRLAFCARVLPGDYVVVVTPPSNIECEIFAEKRHIGTEPGADVGDVLLSLRQTAVLRGMLETPDHAPVSAAPLEAHALGRELITAGADAGVDANSVASYNRSVQATTDAGGRFRLATDIGSYDLVFKPAPDSGFAWQVLYDLDIDTPSDTFSTNVVLDAPIVIDGKLSYSGGGKADQSSLAGADVQAYATVDSAGTTRTIEVARTVADKDGNITLLISPKLHQGL